MEHHLAKVGVAGSIPVSRSKQNGTRSGAVFVSGIWPGSGPAKRVKIPLQEHLEGAKQPPTCVACKALGKREHRDTRALVLCSLAESLLGAPGAVPILLYRSHHLLFVRESEL